MWERRAPLAPQHVRKLVKKGIKVIVQPSNRRAYPAQSYQQVGALGVRIIVILKHPFPVHGGVLEI